MNFPNLGEIQYIRQGLLNNIRADGRSNNQRRLNITQTGILSSCNGSSLVEDDNQKIYVGIKLEIGSSPLPDQGVIIVKIDSMKRRDSKHNESESSDKNKILLLESLLTNYFIGPIDKSTLVLVKGKKCWVLNIEIFLLNFVDLNLIEQIAFAVNAALKNLQIPQVKIDHNHLTNEDEFEIIHDKFNRIQFEIPQLFIVGQVNQDFVIDLCFEEFYAMDKKYLVLQNGQKINMIKSYDQSDNGFQPEDILKLHEFLRQFV